MSSNRSLYALFLPLIVDAETCTARLEFPDPWLPEDLQSCMSTASSVNELQ